MYMFEINGSYNHIWQTLGYRGSIVQQNKPQVLGLFWVSEFKSLGPVHIVWGKEFKFLMITEKDIKYQRHACLMQPYISNVFVVSLSFWKKNCLCQTIKNSSIRVFDNAVFWKSWMYAKVRKCNIWKMRCACYSLGILLLLIVQVVSSYRWGVMKLCLQGEEKLLPLVSPSQ